VKTPRLTSTDNPRVKAVVRLRDSRDRRATGLFIAEGFREVERALGAGLRLVEWYACPELMGTQRPPFLAGPAMPAARSPAANRRPAPNRRPEQPALRHAGDAPGFEVAANVLRKLAYRDDPEGLIAVFEQPRFSLAALPDPPDSLYLVAAGIEKPGNLGAMARTASAAGAAALLTADVPIDPFNPNAIRASTGAVFTLPVVSATSQALSSWMKDRRIRVFAATQVDDAIPYAQADFTGKVAIVIGAEDEGLPAAWLDLARSTGGGAVVIPMSTQRVDSLNASVAAGVLMFEVLRQRAKSKASSEIV
jgi:TrmH family RNA methyltransferase